MFFSSRLRIIDAVDRLIRAMDRVNYIFYITCLSLALVAALAWIDIGFTADHPQSIQELVEHTWRVTGTVKDSISGQEIAIIEHSDSGRSLAMRMGEQLSDGFVLDQVSHDVVVFRMGSDFWSIEITRGNKETIPASALDEEKKTQASLPEDVSESDLQRISVSLQRIEELLSNQEELLNEVGLETVTDDDGNKSLRIIAKPGNQILAEFGLSDGDILLAANGKPVTMPDELLAIVLDAEPGEPIPVALRRAGEIKQISYQIKE